MNLTNTVWLRGLLSPERVADLRRGLGSAPFVDGRATAHGAAREAKSNEQLEAASPRAQKFAEPIVEALSRDDRFRAAVLPRTILPFMFARYKPGMSYGPHLDLPVMGTAQGPLRTDLSITVFLSEPSAYDGGALVLPGVAGDVRVRGGAGDAFLYPSHTLHRVEPVTRGERLVAVSWVQSLVADHEARAVLAELGFLLSDASLPEGALASLREVHHRLVRRWAR